MLRTVFFLFVDVLGTISVLLEHIMYKLPYPIQFATFSLLAIFYASLIYANSWRAIRKFYFLAYAVINIIFLVLVLSNFQSKKLV